MFEELQLTSVYSQFLLPKVDLKQMNKEKSGIFSKWLIHGIEGFCFGSDKNLYRLPFKSGRNHFGIRCLKKQPKDRWKIEGKWWSERQLKAKIYINPNPELLIENTDCPF